MAVLGLGAWLIRVLQLLPAPLHRALDAWSYRLALKRRDKRRRPR